MPSYVVNLLYLLAAALFILGLKQMSHPRTAVGGNALSSLGMLVAVVVTLFDRRIMGYEVILAGFVVGALIGIVVVVRAPFTAMPQLVGAANGFGGGASVLVVGAAILEAQATSEISSVQVMVATAASCLIGAVTFWGSFVAVGKLQGLVHDRPVLFPGRHLVNGALLIVTLVLGGLLVVDPSRTWLYWPLAAVASVLGLLLVLPIGGADMPVVISLLNSYSGLAAAATGFVLGNDMLIIAGSLVGSAGFILTRLMCKAMNRSLFNVLFGGVGTVATSKKQEENIYAGRVKSATPEEVAMIMAGARRVVVVPGYGMAVAQAQHAVRDLANLLESRGTVVEFAIHPVAGRMPGHMNILLAEADIAYDKLKEIDQINGTFKETDLALVIGANDVVNPMARNADPSIPISGMPILNVDQARAVVVIKRSLSPGFAGIPNPLFAADNCLMLFSDAKQGILDLVSALKQA